MAAAFEKARAIFLSGLERVREKNLGAWTAGYAR
jgi:hypothetical protein